MWLIANRWRVNEAEGRRGGQTMRDSFRSAVRDFNFVSQVPVGYALELTKGRVCWYGASTRYLVRGGEFVASLRLAPT